MKKNIILVLSFLLFTACSSSFEQKTAANPNSAVSAETPDPPEVALGERLFRETRFAQFFFQQRGNNMNIPLASGDPVMEFTETLAGPIPGAYAGKTMNCAACHLVDEHVSTAGGGMRTYSEFSRRSLIPLREDGRTVTPRNSPPLVNSTIASADNLFLHFDGQFGTIEDLVKTTFTGRNFGWLPDEADQAQAHLVKVIRQDNGQGDLAQNYAALPYAKVLAGTASDIPEEYRLPQEYRIQTAMATDEEVFEAVAKLVGVYVNNLIFTQNDQKEFTASPYDVFLKKNNLPKKPNPGESDLEYSRRLKNLIDSLTDPQWVGSADGNFVFHQQDFIFGPTELLGLKIFFSELATLPNATQLTQGGMGNCIACHAAPNFTDFKFHNTGAAQEEYDSMWGEGAFMTLSIPDLATRNSNPDAYLAPSANHPQARGLFLSVPSASQPGYTDLGVWNVYANSDHPNVQDRLQTLLCSLSQADGESCDQAHLLDRSIATFKTPGLRDLGMSEPYLHTGQKDTLEDVIEHYRIFSGFAREGKVRNADTLITHMALVEGDKQALTAFLKSLNEDYQ